MTRVTDLDALVRRVEAAIANANVSRAALEFDWPECHQKKCGRHHANAGAAFTSMKIQVMQAVRNELLCESTTRPDIAEDGDSAEEVAIYTLAELLNRYNVHDAGTFVKAARMIVEAYPSIIPAMTAEGGSPRD